MILQFLPSFYRSTEESETTVYTDEQEHPERSSSMKAFKELKHRLPSALLLIIHNRVEQVPLRLVVSCGGVGGKATKGTGSERDCARG